MIVVIFISSLYNFVLILNFVFREFDTLCNLFPFYLNTMTRVFWSRFCILSMHFIEQLRLILCHINNDKNIRKSLLYISMKLKKKRFIWRPARQTNVTAKNYWSENRIMYNHPNTSIVLVVTSLCFTGLRISIKNKLILRSGFWSILNLVSKLVSVMHYAKGWI